MPLCWEKTCVQEDWGWYTSTQKLKTHVKAQNRNRRQGDTEDRVPTHRQVWLAGEPIVGTNPGTGHDPIKVQTEEIRWQLQLVQFSEALRVSEALRSSLMTADKASGLMPCSHSLTHMDKDSMSKPVFSNLEISSSTSIVSRTALRFVLAALAMMCRLNGAS